MTSARAGRRRRAAFALAAALLAPFAAAAATFGAEKPFGILVLGEGGDDGWRQTVEWLRRDLSRRYPLEFVSGLAEGPDIQKGVEGLEAQRVRMIVAVPLFMSSFSEVMDQNRYFFGVREKPSKEFFSAFPRVNVDLAVMPRVRTKLPVVVTTALDDHPLLVEILAERALALARDPAKETLLLVGEGPSAPEAHKDWLDGAQALAEKVRQKAGMAAAAAASLRSPADAADRERTERDFRKLVAALRRKGTVAIVPLELSRTPGLARLAQVLDGLFVRMDARPLLPDARISRWVEEAAVRGSALPDMRRFKKAPKASPKIPSLPAINTKPDKQPGGYR